MNLNDNALAWLRGAGIGPVQWARENGFADGVWGGDACGCPDDRCIGFHHDEHAECGCLPALLASRATPRKER